MLDIFKHKSPMLYNSNMKMVCSSLNNVIEGTLFILFQWIKITVVSTIRLFFFFCSHVNAIN